MPRPSAHLLALAKVGAEHRYRELQNEIRALIQQFPHLRGVSARTSRAEASTANDDHTSTRRRHRGISRRTKSGQRTDETLLGGAAESKRQIIRRIRSTTNQQPPT